MTSPRTGSLRSLIRMFSYLRPYRASMILMVTGATLGTGAGLVVPIITEHVVDGPVRHHDEAGLVSLAALALAFGLAEAGLVFLRRWTQAYLALGMETRVRDDLFQHLQRLPVSFHDTWQSGQLLSRATSDLSQIRRFLSFGLVFLFVNLGTYLTVVILLLRINVPLGLLVAVAAVPLFLVSRSLSRSYMKVARKVQDQQGDLATYIEESALGVRTIRSFGRADYVGSQFRGQAQTLYETSMDKARVTSKFWSTFDLIPSLTLSLVLLVGARDVAGGSMTLGQLIAFVTLMLTLSWPIDSLGFILANGQEALTAADRIYEVLDTRSGLVDGPLTVSEGPGTVRFEGVSFAYAGGADILHDIDLEIRAGETMAVVGVTGSGKTTLTALVPRLYDVTAGRVMLDGVDVRELTLATLRTRVATAFEDPTLFSASVRENVALGRPDATEAQVLEAIEIAQAGFVHELPWGLDTRIGEQGLSLSGGQRQRLALARAVLGRPPVLVLDDPLSALDVHTEALVEQALRRVLQGTTALLVVHRPSTIALADRVAFLERGTIVAVGTHAELLATLPSYRAVLSAEAEAA